jgi:hypothetical protein
MENNQRALDWLEDNLIGNPHSEEDFKHNIMIWGQAKQMEKEQIVKANDDGALMAYALPFNAPFKKGEEYYNETYGSQAPQRLEEANEE